jgi:hypothetical protein
MKRTLVVLRLSALAASLLTGCIHSSVAQQEAAGDPGTFERRVVFTSTKEGAINSITTINSGENLLIAVGGQRGAAFLTRGYIPKRHISFANVRAGEAVPVDVEGDGQYEFMDRGGGWAPVQLISAKGQLLWRFPHDRSDPDAADQMAAVNMDGNGVLEFIVGMNAAAGLYALKPDGSVKWRHNAKNVSNVEILDLNGDGHSEIVHIDGADIVIRQLDGTAIRRFNFPVHPLRHLVWKLDDGRNLIVGTKGHFIHLFDPFGNEAFKVRLPQSKGYPDSVQPIRLEGTQCYASANRIAYSYDIGHLYIFDVEGKVLYHEKFPARVSALATVQDSKNAKNEILLVGVGAQLVEYRKNRPK